MISFSAPWVLLALAGLPVIWWLLRATPPPPKTTPFGAMVYLEQLKDAPPRAAVTPWWLLLLRLLAIAAIIFAIAGPILQDEKTPATVADQTVILVDDGWLAAPGWEDAVQFVQDEATRSGGRDQPVWLLFASTPELMGPMPLGQAARQLAQHQPRATLPNRGRIVEALSDGGKPLGSSPLLWLSNGTIGRTGADSTFLNMLNASPNLTIFRSPTVSLPTFTDLSLTREGMSVSAHRIDGDRAGSAELTVEALATDGRSLGTFSAEFPARTRSVDVPITLPLELRNDIARLQMIGPRSAGRVWLLDAGARRVRAGLVTGMIEGLTDSGFYLARALEDSAEIVTGSLDEVITDEVQLIVLDDVAAIASETEHKLLGWLQRGGVLVQFAGPNMAATPQLAAAPRAPNLPVRLRGTERSFGGALTWSAPQQLSPFPAESPFAGLIAPDDIDVRRQVLSRPASADDGDVMIWAELSDGTPLVSARREGNGTTVLFHVTAGPTWSDLPLSGNFPQMLSRIAELSAQTDAGPTNVGGLAPYLLLNGKGQLASPAVTAASLELGGTGTAPGLYGNAERAVAVNTYAGALPRLDPLDGTRLPSNALLRGPDGNRAQSLAGPLFCLGLLLLALDALAMAALRRVRTIGAAVALAALISIGISASLLPTAANAQISGSSNDPLALRPPLDEAAVEATLEVRLAYVVTGLGSIDRRTEAGLSGISREAYRRSALEPGEPVGVDIESDDLSVYPLIYWPISAETPPPSIGALSRLERFMALGGMLVIDTRDGDRRAAGSRTEEQRIVEAILLRMNTPVLQPMPSDHILKKSFYNLEDLPGRNRQDTVWVEATSSLGRNTDAVPSLIISGRDWASAWATDEFGVPLVSPGADGARGRELAIRAGINMAMVALTGNYKGDQPHVRALLQQLGEEGADAP